MKVSVYYLIVLITLKELQLVYSQSTTTEGSTTVASTTTGSTGSTTAGSTTAGSTTAGSTTKSSTTTTSKPCELKEGTKHRYNLSNKCYKYLTPAQKDKHNKKCNPNFVLAKNCNVKKSCIENQKTGCYHA